MKDDKRVFVGACSNFKHVALSRWSDNHGEFLLMFYAHKVGKRMDDVLFRYVVLL